MGTTAVLHLLEIARKHSPGRVNGLMEEMEGLSDKPIEELVSENSNLSGGGVTHV